MSRWKKSALLIWFLLWIVWCALILQPESRGILRVAVLILFSEQCLFSLVLFWRQRRVRISLLAFIAILSLIPLLPSRSIQTESLRGSYIQSLKSYENTRYYWGGENIIGIDCSGLVRKGFIAANAKLGVTTLNGAHVREAISLWWYDASAKAMRDEYRGETVLLFDAPSINALNHSRLLPGDIAVMETGSHTLVYVGDEVWMHAAPDRGRAQYETIPVLDSHWFDQPVRFLRWQLLTD